jgi:hypothetical protein
MLPGKYTTIAEIKRANREYSEQNDREYWFGKGATRFFGTRVHLQVYGGRWFITSEGLTGSQDPNRGFCVRRIEDDGRIRTEGMMNDCPDLETAIRKARALAEQAMLAFEQRNKA